MAIFKCKMCGGALEIMENATVVCCDYCGTQQTLPKLDDERRANLYDRANHFRRSNEFDKAMGIYEQILNEDKTDAEAYWSLVLCRFGIEYVEDPATRKRVPTVNRAQLTSIFNDENYKSALQYADSYQRGIYEEEAKAINEIQKGILAISQKEEPFDVFICYKETDNNGRRTPDSVLANDLYHQLTREGFKVFFSRITLEDKLGTAYEPYIFAALNSAKVMVVLGTKPEYFNAVWVKNEWSRYLALIKQGANKVLVPAYKDMDPYDLPEEFSHLQAQDMSKLGFMQDLIHGIKKIAKADEPKTTVVRETVSVGNANTNALLKRAFMFLEDGDFKAADEYCEKVLDIDPENGLAYLGKLMAELNVRNQKGLLDCAEPFDSSNNYQKAIRFGDEKIKTALLKCIENKKSNQEECKNLLAELKNSYIAINEFFSMKIRRCGLSTLKIIWSQIEKEVNSLNSRLSSMRSEISNLEKELSSLGLLHAKRKFEIKQKLEDIKKNIPILELKLKEELDKQKGYNSFEEVCNSYEDINKKINSVLSNIRPPEIIINEINQYKFGIELLTNSAIDKGCITFGSYKQSDNTSQLQDGIEWNILEIKDGKALVISKYALDYKPYHLIKADVTWETCSLRKWLNNDFINAAFSAGERSMIPTVTVSADKNPEYSTNPGNATQDQVFLLSITEANKYFSSNGARQCKPTEYTVANGAYVNSSNGNCWWWLRSPGYDQISAAYVNHHGAVHKGGDGVNYGYNAVRPALWIEIGENTKNTF